MKVTLIGAGSTIFMKNIVGDLLHYPALSNARIALMDIDATRLEESRIVAEKMVASMVTCAEILTFSDQRAALEGADFVIVAFQIGGYRPCTVTDFEFPKNTGCARQSATLLALVASCVGCELCHIFGPSARTCWQRARTRLCCNT